MKQELLKHIGSIANIDLLYTCQEITAIPEFDTWPASLSFHHAYEGGLLAHTVEVADMVTVLAARLRYGVNTSINYDIIITAALWHDVMKVREYERADLGEIVRREALGETIGFKDRWIHTDYGKHTHHIAGSAIEFTVAARKHGVSNDVIEAVQHCILAHHGRKDWGSPVEPQTLEAMILHQADMLSAKFGRTKEVAL